MATSTTFNIIPGYAGHLELNVGSAHGLAAKEGKADPYVVVYVVSSTRPQFPENHGKTAVLKRTTEPAWNESFSFDFGGLASRSHKLRLEVWDYNQVMRDKFLGQAELSLVAGERLHENAEAELELPLGPREGKKESVAGVIRIKAKLTVDYHRLRDERQKEQKEREEKIIEQVQLTHDVAEAVIEAFKRRAGTSRSITRADLRAVVNSLDEASKAKIKEQISDPDALFDTLDINHDGSLDMEEVLFGLSTFATGSLDDKAELVFKAMDLDGSGFLDQKEIKQQLEKLYQQHCTYARQMVKAVVMKRVHRNVPDHAMEPLIKLVTEPMRDRIVSNLQVGYLFQQGDSDNDGKITPEEWRALVKKDELAQWLVCPELYLVQIDGIIRPKLDELLLAESLKRQ